MSIDTKTALEVVHVPQSRAIIIRPAGRYDAAIASVWTTRDPAVDAEFAHLFAAAAWLRKAVETSLLAMTESPELMEQAKRQCRAAIAMAAPKEVPAET